MTSHDYLTAAYAKRDRNVRRQFNEKPAQAWAAVARLCANAIDAAVRENGGDLGRVPVSFLRNVDRLAWFAHAQVEHHAAKALAARAAA